MKPVKKVSLHSCNVLEVESQDRSLWQFNVANEQVKLANRETMAAQAKLPAKAVAKNWRTLWRRKLNIAWLPCNQVFLRVVHLPSADIAELASMVELQLEKLSHAGQSDRLESGTGSAMRRSLRR